MPDKVVDFAKIVLSKIYSIPFLGYIVRLLVAFLKLPRINMHLQRVDQAGRLCEQRFGELHQKHDTLEASWRQHVPAFLNAVSSVGAFAHELARQGTEAKERAKGIDAELSRLSQELAGARLTASQAGAGDLSAALAHERQSIADLMRTTERHWQKIGEVEQRLEFIRREIMFEIRYGGAAQKSPAAIEPRVLNRSALTKEDLRLNLGCGHVPLKGYVNVDMRELPGVDVVAMLDNLPFKPGTVSEILLAHVLEHFTQEELRRKLLPYWLRLLAPGGEFRAIVPDAEAMIAASAAGAYPFEDFREVFFGGQDYTGDFHFNMFTPDSLSQLLKAGGLKNTVIVAAGRPNGRCLEFEIRAEAAAEAMRPT